jgi:hypothetical protein
MSELDNILFYFNEVFGILSMIGDLMIISNFFILKFLL